MSVEHDEDRFEGRLSDALHDIGSGFDADRAALVAAGRARGRRLRLRRRAAVAGGAAGIALVGVGGALLVPWGGAADPLPSSSSVAEQPSGTPSAVPLTSRELITTLEGLLPEGKVSDQEARGTGDSPLPPYVRLVYDDGKGPGAVGVSLNRIEPGSDHARETTDCPDRTLVPHDSCVATRLPDGSLLRLFQGYEYPDRRVDTKLWSADLVTPAGQHVSVSEWNAAAEKDAPVSRSEPPLSTAQLKELVTAQVWRKYVEFIPEDPKQPTASAAPSHAVEPGVDSVLNTLVPLLPKGVDVVEKGEDYTYLVLDDGKGRSYVQIDVQHGMGDVADELFGADSETLPDGTKVVARESGGDKGVEGSVMWTVDTLRTDGFRVVVSAFNAGTQHDAPTRPTPALTREQLREIALSPKWDRFR
ncbi:hypothetical protein J7F01_09265 [Streptomyces sp. ISL-22]|uniref:hypothetical protein n=1 Tax=unclassified Streptomyces TaxID=2593676 RepID=UPI001BE5FDCB|nr:MULTISPECIES: hypothetical protein [unclassified Streptomyces]MBT2417936.1 hypothetical protein [Streptomyces sp. ISL-24]MBT2432389.1 hypothetical protein [Streptomyces sp. ISL-22]